ncbi:MAG: hypothetical protein HKN26_09080, partial [Acidimicrobiales bacterium]|nr:hypothetical protein [Acidimicrobiales bacterium]
IDGNPADYCSTAVNLRNRVDRGADAEAQLDLVRSLAAVSPPSLEGLLRDLFRLLDEEDSVFTVWSRPEVLSPLLAIDRATFQACREAYADQLLLAVLGAENAAANPTTTTTSTTTTVAPVVIPPVCAPLAAVRPFDLDNVGRYGPPLVTAQQTGAPNAVINVLTRLVEGNGVVADVLTLVEYDNANCPSAPVAPRSPSLPSLTTTTVAPTTTAFPAP